MSKLLGVALATVLIGCGTQAPESAETQESLRRPNCAVVLCLAVQCGPGEVLQTKAGQCCPQCVVTNPKVGAGDCACSGGFMTADVCGQFGAPWSWEKWACFWDARSQGGLSESECAAVEAKHQGDGSGSDIYNLGLTCQYGTSDCRNKSCPSGQSCQTCKGVNGTPVYVCLPDGAVC